MYQFQDLAVWPRYLENRLPETLMLLELLLTLSLSLCGIFRFLLLLSVTPLECCLHISCEFEDMVFYNVLIDKLIKYGLDKWAVRWLKTGWTVGLKRIAVSSMKSSYKLVLSGVLQGLILPWWILLNIFVSDMDDGIECTLGDFADVAKLGGVADDQMSGLPFRGILLLLGKKAKRNLLELNKGKCEVLYLGRNNPCTSTFWGPTNCKAALQKRTWRFWWTPSQIWDSNASLQQRNSTYLGCLRKSTVSRSRNVNLSLCLALVERDTSGLLDSWLPTTRYRYNGVSPGKDQKGD